MNGLYVRRCLVFLATIVVHCQSWCVTGMCEPAAEHASLMVADKSSIVIQLALTLALLESELWPRTRPFMPLPSNVICVLDLLVMLAISNLMMRLIWLPLVHISLLHINCSVSSGLLKLNGVVFPRGKKNAVARVAAWLCTTDGVNATAMLVAIGIVLHVIEVLYKERLLCLYRSLLRCSSVSQGPPDETPLVVRGRSRRTRRTCAPPATRLRDAAGPGDSVGSSRDSVGTGDSVGSSRDSVGTGDSVGSSRDSVDTRGGSTSSVSYPGDYFGRYSCPSQQSAASRPAAARRDADLRGHPLAQRHSAIGDGNAGRVPTSSSERSASVVRRSTRISGRGSRRGGSSLNR